MTIDKKKIIFPLISSLILTFDQISKSVAPNYFNVVCNKGIAFGIGSDATLISGFVLVVVFWILTQEKNRFSILGLSLIFGGGISNLIDRINLGCVRDFVTLGNFPSFNLADSVITLGALIIIGQVFLKKK